MGLIGDIQMACDEYIYYRFFFDNGETSYLGSDNMSMALEIIEEEIKQGNHGDAKRVIKIVETN
jgi:hypothetical protein